jgi:transcription elongation factor GreA
MATNYMTKGQYERHCNQVRIVEEKISEAKMKVGEAAKLGDLSENAEYDAAREEVEFLTTRYQELQAFLVGMQVVDSRRTDPKMVTVGKTVNLRDPESGEEFTYNVVGGGWTDAAAKEVSYLAPLAAGLIGRRAGDTVEVQVPNGARTLEIISVRPYD